VRNRAATRALIAAAALVVVASAAAAAVRAPEARLHRLKLPPAPVVTATPPPAPTPPPPLPSVVGVDQREFGLTLSRLLVAAGDVSFRIFNRGEDDHDLAVVDADGVLQKVDIPPGQDRTLVARLPKGNLKIYCTLPGHEALGMVSFLEAR
jgi:FtsP/CotA-like multicopper oxidase with cupredoxin domain